MAHLDKEFDKYADNYTELLDKSVSISGYKSDYFAEYKIREIHAFLSKHDKTGRTLKFLNFGCGTGNSEPFINKYFGHPDICSIDVSEASIQIARERNKDSQNIDFKVFDGLDIPYDSNFDIIIAAGVFHHIPRKDHETVLSDIRLRLGAEGVLFIFEHNPWNPLTRGVVDSCEMDRSAELLSPSYAGKLLAQCGYAERELNFIIFFPYFLRCLLPVEKLLRKFPLGAQYYYACRKV